jgi:hypothetical protein
VLTFTSPHGATDVPHNPPSQAYLAMIAEGLRESRDWDEEQIEEYFTGLVA